MIGLHPQRIGFLMPVFRYKTNLIPYQVRRSARAKHLRLEWRSSQASCVAPVAVSSATILKFLQKHGDWLIQQQNKQQALVANGVLPWPKQMADGAMLPYLGVPLELVGSETTSIQRRHYRLHYPKHLQGSSLEQAVKQWLEGQGLRFAQHWSKKIARNFGLKPRSIRFRTQKSRWGSCGIHDDIYLNWRLICCPRRVFMYVVAHEHCHLAHRNHSKAFWQLVSRVMRDYKRHDKWLNQHGSYVDN